MKSTNEATALPLSVILAFANPLADASLCSVVAVRTTALGSRLTLGLPVTYSPTGLYADRTPLVGVPLSVARKYVAENPDSDVAIVPVSTNAHIAALAEVVSTTAWFASDDAERDANGRKTLAAVLRTLCGPSERVHVKQTACGWCQTAIDPVSPPSPYSERPTMCKDCRTHIAEKSAQWESVNRAPVYCNSALLAAAVQKRFGRGKFAPVVLIDEAMPVADDAAIAAAPKRRATRKATTRKPATVAAPAPVVVDQTVAAPETTEFPADWTPEECAAFAASPGAAIVTPAYLCESEEAAVAREAAEAAAQVPNTTARCQECSGAVALPERGDEGLEMCAACGGNMLEAPVTLEPEFAGIPTVRVRRVKDAQGAMCRDCSAVWNITTEYAVPWGWRKSQAMHERGTGHRTELYALAPPPVAQDDNAAPYLPSDGAAPGIANLIARKEAEIRSRVAAEDDNAITTTTSTPPVEFSRSAVVYWPVSTPSENISLPAY